MEDAVSYSMRTSFRKALAIVSALPATVSIVIIRLYQKTLSLDHGPLRHLYPYGFCRHEPTCSAYAIQQLKTQKYLTAAILILQRILSCHPWNPLSDEKIRTLVQAEKKDVL